MISRSPKNQNSYQNIDFSRLNGIDPKSNTIKKIKFIKERPLRVIANNKLKPRTSPKKVSYGNLFNDLNAFYSDFLLQIKADFFKIQPGGFLNVENNDIGRVYQNSNLMVFKDKKTDINAATGMRNYGPFKYSEKAKDVKFIFIYEHSDDANKLYQYLKNGLRHFPGLHTYIGIPPTLSDSNIRLKYERQNLRDSFYGFLSENFPLDNYNEYFAIVISPYNKNSQLDDFKEPELYYEIKRELLKKGVSSQFIFYQNIRSDKFHFYLPNIAVGILAKLGGIPWKLKEHPYSELIVGFNTKRINDTQYYGSSIFFNNEGYLKSVNSYEGNNLREIVSDLRKGIDYYISENSEETLKRIIIHTYKPYGKREQKIEDLLQNELHFDIPIIFIEVNESKTTNDICFDENYNHGMPISGTFVKIGWNEYLLFNNTRYHEKPERSIKEEWPIKIRIYSSSNIPLDNTQLISQVYEFSRLYWRGLKQKSQPVTSIYSKIIADFRGHFGEQIPNNDIAQHSPWFL